MIINLASKDFNKLSDCFAVPRSASRLGGIAMTTKDLFRILLELWRRDLTFPLIDVRGVIPNFFHLPT